MFKRGIGIVAIFIMILCLGGVQNECELHKQYGNKGPECGFNRPAERDINKGRTSA